MKTPPESDIPVAVTKSLTITTITFNKALLGPVRVLSANHPALNLRDWPQGLGDG